MKPRFSILIDLITIIALWAYLALYMVGFFAPRSDFVAAHGLTMWGGFAAVVCFLYAFAQAGQRSLPRFFVLFVRVLFCLSLALSINSIVYVRWYRPDDGEWSLGVGFLAIMAMVSGVPAFVVGYTLRAARDRLTAGRHPDGTRTV